MYYTSGLECIFFDIFRSMNGVKKNFNKNMVLEMSRFGDMRNFRILK